VTNYPFFIYRLEYQCFMIIFFRSKCGGHNACSQEVLLCCSTYMYIVTSLAFYASISSGRNLSYDQISYSAHETWYQASSMISVEYGLESIWIPVGMISNAVVLQLLNINHGLRFQECIVPVVLTYNTATRI
jgi:hypothetical protein